MALLKAHTGPAREFAEYGGVNIGYYLSPSVERAAVILPPTPG